MSLKYDKYGLSDVGWISEGAASILDMDVKELTALSESLNMSPLEFCSSNAV